MPEQFSTDKSPVRLSIGVISFAADGELTRTLKSLGEVPPDVEVCVQLHRNEASKLDPWLTKIPTLRVLPAGDNGIFNAMNRIRSHAHGDYLWFLNAGDTRHEKLELCDLLNTLADTDDANKCFGFQSLQTFGEDGYRRPGAANDDPKPIEIGHQSAVYSRAAYKEICFLEARKVSADQQYNQDCFSQFGFHYVPRILSIFALGGVSNRFQLKDWHHFAQEPAGIRLRFLCKVVLRTMLGQQLLYRLLYAVKYDRIRINLTP